MGLTKLVIVALLGVIAQDNGVHISAKVWAVFIGVAVFHMLVVTADATRKEIRKAR